MDNANNKKCWCYVTYAFLADEIPPLPLPQNAESPVKLQNGAVPPLPQIPQAEPPSLRGFEPTWFLNARFPEDED